MKLIDKDALVAEIKKRIQESLDAGGATRGVYLSERMKEDSYILSFLDTLEVKEVDLEKELIKWHKEHFKKDGTFIGMSGFYLTNNSQMDIAKHFFELGLKAKDWEKERMEECPYRQAGCTMYEGKILECRGACSWVVDYPKLKELKAKKVEEV